MTNIKNIFLVRLNILISTLFKRWYSQLNVLIWAQSFYDSLQCPVILEEIEIYLQILMSIFDFNLGLQGSRSSICDVFPGLLNLINRFSKFLLYDRARELCYFLVRFLKLKFHYELNSLIYMVDN